MPGAIELLGHNFVGGWAMHPIYASYPMTVHVTIHGRILRSALGNLRRADGRNGFLIEFSGNASQGGLQVLLGETNETLAPAGPTQPVPERMVTIEDLLGVHPARPWIYGACYLDGQRAGLRPATIIDLLCRDYLGRPAEESLLREAVDELPRGGYDGFRHRLLTSWEYLGRTINVNDAPGGVFSSATVLSVAGGDFDLFEPAPPTRHIVVPDDVYYEPGIEGFIVGCYRRVLGIEPDVSAVQRCIRLFSSGQSRLDILKAIVAGF